MPDLHNRFGTNSFGAADLIAVKQLVERAKGGADILAELSPLLSTDKPATTRAAAVGALRQCGENGLPGVIAALADPDDMVKIMAVRSFAALTMQGHLSAEGMQALGELVCTGTENVRAEASRTVGDLGEAFIAAMTKPA